MSISMILLTVIAVLVFFGVLERVLDRMHLTDRMALLLIALMFLGTLLPNVSIGMVSVNIGGAVIPLGVCIYLLAKSDSTAEKARSLMGMVITGAAVWGLSKFLPDEPEAMLMEPNLLYGIAAGAIAWILGRSRRGAFFCGVTGVLLADVVTAVLNWSAGINQRLVLGGAGIADTVVLAGVIGVLLAELLGETVERVSRAVRTRRGGNV